MTPLEIGILLHYHYSTEDYRQGDFSAPAVRSTIDEFRDKLNLLGPSAYPGQTYQLTDRGKAYVRALCSLPLPDCRWVIHGVDWGESVDRP